MKKKFQKYKTYKIKEELEHQYLPYLESMQTFFEVFAVKFAEIQKTDFTSNDTSKKFDEVLKKLKNSNSKKNLLFFWFRGIDIREIIEVTKTFFRRLQKEPDHEVNFYYNNKYYKELLSLLPDDIFIVSTNVSFKKVNTFWKIMTKQNFPTYLKIEALNTYVQSYTDHIKIKFT
jgi:hypothetical protein